MKLYKIRDWEKHFENNRSRTVTRLSWVSVPNKHDGEHYSAMMKSKDGAEIFAAWVLMLQVASKCSPRGTLIKSDGAPHDPPSLSLKTRAPQKWFEKALSYLEKKTDWLEVKDVAPACQDADTRLSPACHPPDEGMEGNGRERTEGKGTPPAVCAAEAKVGTEARIVLHYLNERSGRHFREVGQNLPMIQARLNEPEVTVEGVKQMIDRQVGKWKGDSRMEDYLRPETLFGKQKFDAYYAAKDQPITPHGKDIQGNRRNALACKPVAPT